MEKSNGQLALKIAIYAALTYDIISATNSSPQTTEINASVRADTLMKWVHLGLAQAAMFILLGAAVDRSEGHSGAGPLIGGGLAGALIYAQYVHAKESGLANAQEPGTETPGGWG